MKLNLLFYCFLFLASSITFSQTLTDPTAKSDKLHMYNLYYLSKYIVANNLSTEMKSQVYSALIYSISKDKTDAYWMSKTSNSTQKTEKEMIKGFLDGIYVNSEEIKSQFLKGEFSMYDNFESLNNKLEKIKSIYNTKLSIPKDTLDYRIKVLDALKITSDSLEIQNYFKKHKFLAVISIDKSSSKENIQSAIDNFTQLSNGYKTNLDDYTKEVGIYAKEYGDKFLSEYKVDIPADLAGVKVTSNQADFSTNEFNVNAIIQSSEQRSASATYKLPSESDMINAMAIFLAKRAQQETAIWFMDKIRENIKNPLIYEAFPETIKLIERLEDFKTPNFSVAWRYAIASDFVKMPTNLAQSAWVNNFIFDGDPKKAELFNTSVTFCYNLNRLVAEKYNYRDIIRYFYTTPQYDFLTKDADQKYEMKELLKKSITILYILTNEFFAIDEIGGEKNYRLLSYEEISAMSAMQWRALGELIQLKYGANDDTFQNFFKNEFNQQQQPLSKWVGNLLISLSQFDKVNKDFQKKLDKEENDPNYNFYNVWQNTLQIIDNLDYKSYLVKNKELNPNIEILKEATTIYEDIQNKNYSEAIQTALRIIRNISNNNINKEKFDLYFNNKKLIFDNGIKTISFENQTYDINLVGKTLEISNGTEKIKFENFPKIQPFLKFLSNSKNDNFGVVNALNSSFKSNLDTLKKKFNFNETEIISLMNLIGLSYDKKGIDQQKIFALINTPGVGINYTSTNKELERIKLKNQDQLLKLTAFFGDVLVAKDAQELANVIDSHALPPTSYKLKRRVSRSIDLNGYVGLQGSRMWASSNSSLKTQYTAGITAPIGFAYTWTNLKSEKPNNWGFTVDIIDLGNIVNHYLVNSTDDYAKDVHFSEVFSPAFSGMYALRKTPFVVFASVKFLPLKSSYNQDQILINSKAFDAVVLSVGLKIDIPLVNLWSMVK